MTIQWTKQKQTHLVIALVVIAMAQVLILIYYFHAVAEENRNLQAASTLPKIEVVWPCGSWPGKWDGKKYPTEQSMKGTFE